jgi:hypothetical protein
MFVTSYDTIRGRWRVVLPRRVGLRAYTIHVVPVGELGECAYATHVAHLRCGVRQFYHVPTA